MDRKIKGFVEPGIWACALIMAIFAAASFFVSRQTAPLCAAAAAALLLAAVVLESRGRRNMRRYIESVVFDADTAGKSAVSHFSMPMVVFRMADCGIVWANAAFFEVTGLDSSALDSDITELIPGFSTDWISESAGSAAELLPYNERKYRIDGMSIYSHAGEEYGGGEVGVTYWIDVTEYDEIKRQYISSRPVVGIVAFDNYEELMKTVNDKEKSSLRGQVDDLVSQWGEGRGGFIRRYDRDKYMFVFEEQYLQNIIESKFKLLEDVHAVVNTKGIHATLSIAMGHDGSGVEEDYRFANLALEMALSRGGDQAVIKNRFNFEFYGGRGVEVETRTKVRSRVIANAFSALVEDASQIFVMGHKCSDLDSVGGAAGICCISRKLGKKCFVVVNRKTSPAVKMIDWLSTVPEYKDVFISPQDAMVRADSGTLLVVIDTNRPEQTENPDLLMACRRIAVIDHHRRAATYIDNADLTFHEPYASSVCELITELMQELVEQPDIKLIEAEAVLAGIVMDTKSFAIRTGERTFDAAAFLRRAGADTSVIKRILQNDLDHTVARYRILQRAKLYCGSIAIAAPETVQDRVVAAQAADELLNISGVDASIVVFPVKDGGVMLSARSIGDINVQVLLEKLGGGGNRSAAGAQLPDASVGEAVEKLLKAIDDYMEE